jgi:tetratricopeptide (TPR) repeat protein
LHHEVGDQLGEARAHNEIALLTEQQGRPAEALSHAQLSLSLYRDAQYGPGLAKMLNGVGYLHAQLGDYEQALDSCEQALSLYRELGGDPPQRGSHLGQHRLLTATPGPLRRGD